MRRLLAMAVVVASLVVLYVGALSTMDAGLRFYAVISTFLLAGIVVVVLGSSLLTLVYLVGFGALGRPLIGNHFPLFVCWTLLRSHRVVPTVGSRWRGLLQELRARRPSAVVLGLILAVVLLVGAWLLGAVAPWNAVSESTSPWFARTVQFTAVGLGLLIVLLSVPGLLGPQAKDAGHRVKERAWVTLPTFISIVGVAIGIWALVVVLSVMHGFESDLRDKILRTNAHIVVEPESSVGSLGDGFALQDAVRALPGIVEAHAFASGEVMMSSSTNIAVNVMVKGMSPRDLESSEQLRGRVSPGEIRWLDEPELVVSDRFRYPLGIPSEAGSPLATLPSARRATREVLPGILLGVELASSLNVDVGAEIQVISPDGDVGPTGLRPKLRAFRVVGIFTTGMYEYDQKLAYMAIDDAQRFFNLGSEWNQLEVRVASADDTAPVLAAMNRILAQHDSPLIASDWKARNRNLFSALQLERIVMFVVLGIIILVASLLIVSSLVMLVVEKARDIAILKALGASNRSVVLTFLVIGGGIGAIGSASGITMGVATCLAIDYFGFPLPREYYISELPVVLDAMEVFVVGVSAFVICVLATIYPSLEASSLRPVEGLRHG